MAEHSSSSVFVRQSSGLVREASALDAMIFNAVFSAPVGATLAFGIFYALGTSPGADIVLALVIAFVVNIPVCIMMSMMASAMPRVGGDYVWISRILHPAVAVYSNFSAAISALIGAAFWARSFAVLAVGPTLAVLGAVFKNSALINAGNTVSGTNAVGEWWTFGLGLLLIIVLALSMSSGTKTVFRLQNVCWIIASIGTFLAFASLLIASNQSFIANFNSFAQPFTHAANSFQAIQHSAAKSGFTFTGNHPFSATLPVVAIIMTFMMWNWWSVYIAGELKSAGNLRRQLSIMIGALIWDSLFMIVGVLLLYHAAGEKFIADINYLTGTTAYTLPVQPYYNLMASIAANSSIFAVLIAISFLFWNLPAMFPNTFMPVRTIFAWSFDRILPGKLSEVNERTHAPIPAIITASIIVLAILVWSVLTTSFFTLLSIGRAGRSSDDSDGQRGGHQLPVPPPGTLQKLSGQYLHSGDSRADHCGSSLYGRHHRAGLRSAGVSTVGHRTLAGLPLHGFAGRGRPANLLHRARRAQNSGRQPRPDLSRVATRVITSQGCCKNRP